MKYGITLFGRDGSNAFEGNVIFKIDGGWDLEPILQLWCDSNKRFSLEEAMTIIEAEGYVLNEIEDDGWYNFINDDLHASLVPYFEEDDIDEEIRRKF